MLFDHLRMLTEAADRLSGWIVPLLAQDAALAQAAAEAEPAAQGPGSLLEFLASPMNLILISAILFMFLVARPQQKKRQEQEKAQAELKKNDRVVTHSGIHGVVVQTQDGLVTLRIDENSGARMTVNRDEIASITPSDSKE
ncbi:MAG: preprotein translocase subunit YajC [Planctomycetales bacterium]|nr:preprotein translocase subunit YajC [Planctomycetales bacterium]